MIAIRLGSFISSLDHIQALVICVESKSNFAVNALCAHMEETSP